MNQASARETPLVGRSAELARLAGAISRVVSGEPGVALLTGRAGSGKTRLADEALALAVAAGFGIFSGHADESGMDVAYAPFVEAFGARLRAMDASRRRELAGDLPQLALVIGDLAIAAPRPLGDPGLERARLMDGFALLVDRLARQSPIVILIDDLPSADDASGLLLRHIARTVTDQPVLIVATARTDEPDVSQVTRLLAGVGESSWWTEQIAVEPLDDGDSAVLFSEVVGGRACDDLAELVADRCAGRPLFIEAVGRSLLESGRLVQRTNGFALAEGDLPLPTDVADQLSLRLTLLTPDERVVVEMLAISGGRCEHPVLADACGLGDDRLVAALARLSRRLLMAEDAGSGLYRLANGMLQQAVLAELTPVQRRRNHARFASALEARYPGEPRIVEHLIRAGMLVEPGKTVPRLLAACRHARSLGALDDAIRYLGAAVDIARGHSTGEELAEMLDELGELCLSAGRRGDARQHWTESLALYTTHGNPLGVGRVHRELGTRAWTDGDVDAAERHLLAAGQAFAGLEPSVEHAELLYVRTAQAARSGDPETIASTSHELHELTTRLGLPALAVRAMLAEGTRRLVETDLVGGGRTLAQALEGALELDDADLIVSAYNELSVAACLQGDLPALRRYSEASLGLVRQLGATAMEPWPRMRLVLADLLSGDWDAALRGSSDVIATVTRYGEQRGQVSTYATSAWILVHCGRLADARHDLDKALEAARPMRQTGSYGPRIVAVADVALALAEGRVDDAVEAGGPLADFRKNGWFALIASMQYGEALAMANRTDEARVLAADIRGVRSCSTVLPDAIGNWLDGLTATCGAAALLQKSAGQFERLGFPFHAARARLAQAQAIAEHDSVESTRLAGLALAGFERIGAPSQAQESRELLRALGAVLPRGRTQRTGGSVLSARELEVAQLVASGFTNARVATELFISPRTVTTHLDRIYQRLGLNSRAALTRYMADSGMLDTPVKAGS